MHSKRTFLHIFYHRKGNSEETQRTPAQVILIKLGQMAEGKNDSDWFTNSDFWGSWIWLVNFWVLGWTDFFIGNVIERPGRAENFKERSFLISDWSITFNIFEQNWPIGKHENKTLKARMAARIERIEKHYIDCKRND